MVNKYMKIFMFSINEVNVIKIRYYFVFNILVKNNLKDIK